MGLLEHAIKLVEGDRQESYGDPRDMARAWAQIASAATGIDLRPEHLAVIMIAVKLARQRNGFHYDSMVDLAGYAELANIINGLPAAGERRSCGE